VPQAPVSAVSLLTLSAMQPAASRRHWHHKA